MSKKRNKGVGNPKAKNLKLKNMKKIVISKKIGR